MVRVVSIVFIDVDGFTLFSTLCHVIGLGMISLFNVK